MAKPLKIGLIGTGSISKKPEAILRPFVPIKQSAEIFSDNPYANEIAHFADYCRSGQEPISSWRDNLGTMKIIFGIYASSRTSKVVDLDALN